MSNREIKKTIRRFFRLYSSARIVLPASAGNLYELYVYTIVCEAIQNCGFSLTVESAVPGEFRFRCSPGVANTKFSYYKFSTPSGGHYQIWNGVEVYGNSMMRHEADIAIFKLPSHSDIPNGDREQLILSIECKCYSSSSQLKGEVRKSVGAVLDWSRSAHTSKQGNHPQGCIHCGVGFNPVFVTNIRRGQRGDIEQYLEAYDLRPRFGIMPKTGAVASFKTMLKNEMRGL